MKTSDMLLLATILTGTSLSYAFFNEPLMAFFLLCNFGFLFYMYGVGVLTGLRDAAGILLLIILATMILLLPLAVYKSIYSIYFVVASMVGIVLSYAVSSQPYLASKALRWTLVSIQLSLLAYVAINIGEDPFPLDRVLGDAGSSNVVTSFLILIQSAYVAALFVTEKRAAWLTTLCTFLICFIGYGRGSIIAAAMLFLIVFSLLFFENSKNNRQLNFVTKAAFVVAVILSFFYFSGYIVNLVEANTKLGSGLVDDSRLQMISDYIYQIDGVTLMTGAEYQGTSIINEFGGNPHNSFIRAHHLYGLVYLGVLVCISLVAIVIAGGVGRALLLTSLLCVVNFRAFSEPIIFPTPLDFYYFLIVFLFMRKSRIQSNGIRAGGKRQQICQAQNFVIKG